MDSKIHHTKFRDQLIKIFYGLRHFLEFEILLFLMIKQKPQIEEFKSKVGKAFAELCEKDD